MVQFVCFLVLERGLTGCSGLQNELLYLIVKLRSSGVLQESPVCNLRFLRHIYIRETEDHLSVLISVLISNGIITGASSV